MTGKGGGGSTLSNQPVQLALPEKKLFPKDTAAPDLSQNTHTSGCLLQIMAEFHEPKKAANALLS